LVLLPLLLPMYEFVPLLFGLIGMAYYLVRGAPSALREEQAARLTGSDPPQETALDAEERDDDWCRDEYGGDTHSRGEGLFLAFLILWTLSSLFIYSWAGEKMPWLVVHPALPLIVLAGKFSGDLLGREDWGEIWQRGGAVLALLLPITLFGLSTLIRLQPFQGLSLFKLRETGNWLAALLVTIVLLVLVALQARRLGGRRSFMVTLGTTLAFLSFFTVRFAWMAAFIDYDYATELLVYAHGGADVKPTMDEIAEISRRTVGDKMIEVAYDNEVTWPLEWYMREYPNRKYYGETPTREAMSVPVILSSERNDVKVKPFIGDRYHQFKRRLVWWPNQQYMDLTWERIRDILLSPEKRKALWKILYYRQYPRTPDNWYHVHSFYLYVRKDVAQQLWDFGAVPPQAIELVPDPYTEAYLELPEVSTWGTIGTEAGQFNHPRGLAVGPDGHLYVVDSDNHRIQVFDSSGMLLRAWGTQCNLATGLGCLDPDSSGPLDYSEGQFQEPWGIAVGDDGRVYVADTWNHRVQVFDASGNFLHKWGMFGQTMAGEELYGPRDIAVDTSGRVFVTDTGNKRVMVYDTEGHLLAQWGGGGLAPGRFEEPVGIALDREGNIYVADTWNQRIQVFDSDLAFLREWPVEAWYGESVINKPFLALDGQNRVYLTDPEGYRVAVFSSEGGLLATFGRYGTDRGAFTLPTGIDVDAEGYIYVTDSTGQRVIKFAPLP
jgi:DNA-binding beta-propeller fold protein YncE